MDDALQADDGFGDIAGCLDAINNGRGIGTICEGKKEEAREDVLGRGGMGLRSLTAGGVQLYRPYPNPFTGTMRMSFAVEGSGQQVDIGVYDIAGRLVQNLASGFQGGGVHEVEWNGRDARGGRVGVGVYFVRGLVGDRQVNSRIVLTQ
jgi:flagellar hook assembly protein FlgD